ncbi:MAG: DsbA family protein [Parcubacteria group bacterium]
MEQNKLTLPLAIVVAGALIAVAIYLGGSSGVPSPENIASAAEVAPLTNNDHILGDPNAPIVIVEYSDIECPFCKIFHNTMHQIVDEYEGQVAWVYRHFPIAQLHANATREAEATECVAELGGNTVFWNYLDTLFERTNSNDSLPLTELPSIAVELGLSESAFNECLSSGRHAEFVQNSIEEAVKAGARGTPYSVIMAKDGRQAIINGAEPLQSIKLKIDSLLQ